VPVSEVAIVVRRGPAVLVAQRPPQGRWAEMWEFPHGELRKLELHEQAAVRILAELTALEVDLGGELMTIRHGVTRYRITLVCLEGVYRAGAFASPFYSRAEWTLPRQLQDLPISAPQRLLARSLLGPCQRRLF
jgi:A/G-specific adenine glycosylase